MALLGFFMPADTGEKINMRKRVEMWLRLFAYWIAVTTVLITVS